MIPRRSNLAALLLAAAPFAAIPAVGQQMTQEGSAMPLPRIDRNAPKDVPPITLGGTRFEQVMDATDLGFDQETGYLRAVDAASGRELWVKRVYDIPFDPTMERDVQLRYFRSMALSADGKALVIVNESGKSFSVDPATGASVPLD